MSEARETKIKRLYMRSIRRGIKEMDLILTSYADRHLRELTDDQLANYDALLKENDHDLYRWVTGQAAFPDTYSGIMDVIQAEAKGVAKPA